MWLFVWNVCCGGRSLRGGMLRLGGGRCVEGGFGVRFGWKLPVLCIRWLGVLDNGVRLSCAFLGKWKTGWRIVRDIGLLWLA